LGLALIRAAPARRAVILAGPGLLVLLLASDACFALAHNLPFSDVLAGRVPGTGAWIEGVLLMTGALLPRSRPRLASKRFGDGGEHSIDVIGRHVEVGDRPYAVCIDRP
jgi:hypothetical protein